MCDHAVQFYETETFLIDKVLDFIRPALLNGDSAVVIATPEHRAAIEAGLAPALRAAERPDSGELILLDAAETLAKLMVDGWPEEERFERVIGAVIERAAKNDAAVCAFGEMVALLCAQGQPGAALRLEQLWNGLGQRHKFSLLCAYSLQLFPSQEHAESFLAICNTHSSVAPVESYEQITDADVLTRKIASLEQKARSLEFEVARRAETETLLSSLAARQEQVREEERKRIAREMHDELGGLLTGINAHLSMALTQFERTGAAPNANLVAASKLTDAAVDALRKVITDLRPSILDHLGLWTALTWYAGQMEERTGLRCDCEIDPRTAENEIDPERSIVVFRIVQEALTNVVRHAGASRVVIRSRCDDEAVTVEVEDNGKGVEREMLLTGESWGVVGMHERARHFGGELNIVGAAGKGTTVVLRIPLEHINA